MKVLILACVDELSVNLDINGNRDGRHRSRCSVPQQLARSTSAFQSTLPLSPAEFKHLRSCGFGHKHNKNTGRTEHSLWKGTTAVAPTESPGPCLQPGVRWSGLMDSTIPSRPKPTALSYLHFYSVPCSSCEAPTCNSKLLPWIKSKVIRPGLVSITNEVSTCFGRFL